VLESRRAPARRRRHAKTRDHPSPVVRLFFRRRLAIVALVVAVAVAIAGGAYVVEERAASAARASAAAEQRRKAERLDRQRLEMQRAVRHDQVRASRERARQALAEQRRRAAEARKKRAAELQRQRAVEARRKRAAELQRQRAAELQRRAAERAKRQEAERRRRLARAYVLPLTKYRLSARFGQSGSRWSSTHTGQDFAAPSGTPVRSVATGTVVSAEWAGAYGWRAIVRHADGTETWYCHLSSFVVRSGSVAPGQVIGRVGSTGNSTGPHLHLEVRVDEAPIDPLRWLRRHGVNV